MEEVFGNDDLRKYIFQFFLVQREDYEEFLNTNDTINISTGESYHYQVCKSWYKSWKELSSAELNKQIILEYIFGPDIYYEKATFWTELRFLASKRNKDLVQRKRYRVIDETSRDKIAKVIQYGLKQGKLPILSFMMEQFMKPLTADFHHAILAATSSVRWSTDKTFIADWIMSYWNIQTGASLRCGWLANEKIALFLFGIYVLDHQNVEAITYISKDNARLYIKDFSLSREDAAIAIVNYYKPKFDLFWCDWMDSHITHFSVEDKDKHNFTHTVCDAIFRTTTSDESICSILDHFYALNRKVPVSYMFGRKFLIMLLNDRFLDLVRKYGYLKDTRVYVDNCIRDYSDLTYTHSISFERLEAIRNKLRNLDVDMSLDNTC